MLLMRARFGLVQQCHRGAPSGAPFLYFATGDVRWLPATFDGGALVLDWIILRRSCHRRLQRDACFAASVRGDLMIQITNLPASVESAPTKKKSCGSGLEAGLRRSLFIFLLGYGTDECCLFTRRKLRGARSFAARVSQLGAYSQHRASAPQRGCHSNARNADRFDTLFGHELDPDIEAESARPSSRNYW